MELNAAQNAVVIWIGLAGQVSVPVYTRDGVVFEASPRGIGDDGCASAIEGAKRRIAENPAAFQALVARLLPV